MITLIITIAVLIIIIVIETFVIGVKSQWKDSSILLPLAFLSLITITIIVYTYENEIKPIDVYRGNTTLEITYRDNIIIDSIVVWK
jgi:hypothetical protein